MVGDGAGEALVWAVALIALLLLPLVSWLIAEVGNEIAAELEDELPDEELSPSCAPRPS